MLTRLKVNGFKNLLDVDIAFGPFTCIAGPNGVGKSNLFDAITFLGTLAERPLMDAARCVRDEKNRTTDVGTLFHESGHERMQEMSFEAEMLVPPAGNDDLGQRANAAITFLRYRLVLGLRTEEEFRHGERLEIKEEQLMHVNVSDAHRYLGFPHRPEWRQSVVRGARRGGPFLSTEHNADKRIIKLHQDGGRGRPRELSAVTLPRTVLSSTNADENPTALLARREMQSWRLLQLEPSALRDPDPFSAPAHVGVDGSHLASTLFHLGRAEKKTQGNGAARIYTQVANRLSQLVGDIKGIRVDEDHQRELLTLQVIDRNNTLHASRALSDGTLRFLALTVLELDPGAQGLLCFEEPENGIHPERIPAMLRLLKDLAVDTEMAVGADNPLRQVIVNTHSPAVVALVSDDDLLVAESRNVVRNGSATRGVTFAWLSNTWRSDVEPTGRPLSRGRLAAYLNPTEVSDSSDESLNLVPRPRKKSDRRAKRVKDREDLQLLLPLGASND